MAVLYDGDRTLTDPRDKAEAFIKRYASVSSPDPRDPAEDERLRSVLEAQLRPEAERLLRPSRFVLRTPGYRPLARFISCFSDFLSWTCFDFLMARELMFGALMLLLALACKYLQSFML